MNRREVIQRAALVLGYAITGPALTGVLEGCKASPDLTFKPAFFSEPQAATISAISEIIIPRTDTPGAIDAGVPGFIDKMLKNVYSRESQEMFLKNLTEFEDGVENTYGKSFASCDTEQQTEYFKKHHDAVLSNAAGGHSTGFWNAAVKDGKPFVIEMKELTLLGFFTSEPGATLVLQYKQVPGPYKGCVPLKSVGKAWAT